MPASYAALKTYLSDPSRIGLADQAIADLYNGEAVATSRPLLDVAIVRRWAAANGARAPIEAGLANSAAIGNTTVASICLSIRDFIVGGGSPIDLTPGSSDRQLVDALVSAGVWSDAQRTSLIALATVQSPRYAQPGEFGALASAPDVAHARSL